MVVYGDVSEIIYVLFTGMPPFEILGNLLSELVRVNRD
jgi:hypothetical protein